VISLKARFLYFHSTGEKSQIGHDWKNSDLLNKVKEKRNRSKIQSFEHLTTKETKVHYFSEIIKEFTTKYEIRSIYTYVIQSYKTTTDDGTCDPFTGFTSCGTTLSKIQVITVGTVCENNKNMVWKHVKNATSRNILLHSLI
jgi:hypothetical protein